MKKLFAFIYSISIIAFAGCNKDGNYPGGEVSPYISIYDVRELFKGKEITLTKDVLYGSSKITGVVVSDHSGKNIPEGLLMIQDKRRLGQLRGIAINLGNEASNYTSGDSLVINIEGGVLKREEGTLQIRGLNNSAIKKISSGNSIEVNRVASSALLSDPYRYESTLITIVKGGFNPLPINGETISGRKTLNDGFGNITLNTSANAVFANSPAPYLANFFGLVILKVSTDQNLIPEIHLRNGDDVISLSSTISVSPVVISGFISDVKGGDGNYEYMQFLATKDIDFSITPYSVIVTNNANAATPTGFLPNGWATGGMRTYKMDLTSGTVSKGSYFYVGGTQKKINGPNSTDISSVNWVKAHDYTVNPGDGFGNKTGGLFANSGNASGFAIFEGTNITGASIPVDVIFVGTGGSLYTTTPTPMGYRITNTDWYDIKNPVTLKDQPFYRAGSNTMSMVYTTSDIGYFYKLGGEYNVALGRWMKARTQNNILLSPTSTIADIEQDGTKLVD